jgi:hypothetical protein
MVIDELKEQSKQKWKYSAPDKICLFYNVGFTYQNNLVILVS